MKTLYKDRTNYQGSLLVLIFSPFYAMDKPQKNFQTDKSRYFFNGFILFLKKQALH